MTTTSIKWKRVASFWVPGEPVGQPRHRHTKTGRSYSPNPKRKDGSRPVGAWKKAVAIHCMPNRPRDPFDCPVKVDINFYFPRIKEHYRTGKHAGELKPNAPVLHTVKPDKDNAEKLVLDVMTKAGWWVDDSRVCTGTPTKVYADGQPGAMIEVSVIANPEQESPHAE
jgi:crossover junction endodeoxyribonuclease RusA